jgi:thiol-disulfide isomerase/thioredoxin
MSGSKKAGWAMAAAVLILGIGGAALLYANRAVVFKAPVPAAAPKSDLARFATGPLARLETPGELVVAADHPFKARDGSTVRFADFRGKVVVVNLWAMWCAPCRTEMPTLARLAELYAGQDLVVLPVNVDTGADSIADATSFIDVHEPLPLYNDPEFRLPFLFPGKGKMPQTILLDRQGRIRAAFAGEADWSSVEARALVDALLAESG